MDDETMSPEELAFAERVASPLRAAKPLDTAFEARVMDAVRVESRVRRLVAERRTPPREAAVPAPVAPWWRRSRDLHVTPLSMLAMAAGLVLAAALGALGALRMTEARRVAEAPVLVVPAATPVTDTVHVVRFVFVDSSARTVTLVGDFNAWSRESTPLVRDAASGVWTASVALPAGRHEYAFIVNGERWVADPYAIRVLDDFGTESSVVSVGTRRS